MPQENLLLLGPEEGGRLGDAPGFPVLGVHIDRLRALEQQVASSSSSAEGAHSIL